MQSKEKLSIRTNSRKKDKQLSRQLQKQPSFKSGLNKTINVRRHSVSNRPASQSGHFQKKKIKIEKEWEPLVSWESLKQFKSLSKLRTIQEQSEYEQQKTEKYTARLLAEGGKIHVMSGLSSNATFLDKKNYKYLAMIGKGGFGKVWKVQHILSGKIFALKEMSKATITAKRSIESILNQRNLLSNLRHTFLVNMVYAFQDNTTLSLLMDLKERGDLRYHIAKKHKFTQTETRFICASLILALEYLHKKLIIHRDVKPQNIVFDEQGYANLTDLGIAKQLKEQNFKDTSGTPGYMAPEVMFHHNHRFEVDYYALGVVLYELIIGKRPYLGKGRQQIKKLIQNKQVIITKDQIPEQWTIQSADFVNKLLQRRPMKRLGWGGIHELKQHRWLRDFPWNQLLKKQITSPFTQNYNPNEVRYRPTEQQTQYKKLWNKNKQMLARGNLQEYFIGYTYEGLTENRQFCQSAYLH